MTIPIKKRINTELFIDRKQWLYKQNDIEKNFPTSLKRVNGRRWEVKAGMITETAVCLE